MVMTIMNVITGSNRFMLCGRGVVLQDATLFLLGYTSEYCVA